MSYATLKTVALASLALYVVCAWFVHLYAPNENMYPFFSWNLFSSIPNQVQTYTIAIHSYDGTTYEQPLAFDSSLVMLHNVHRAPSEYIFVIGDLGRAIEASDSARIEQDRHTIEAIFSGHRARYDVRYITYDPLLRWKSGAIESVRMLATFDANTTK